MTIKVRLSGEPTDTAAMIDIAGGDCSYLNRGSSCVRVYLEVRLHTAIAQRVHSERVQPDRKDIEP